MMKTMVGQEKFCTIMTSAFIVCLDLCSGSQRKKECIVIFFLKSKHQQTLPIRFFIPFSSVDMLHVSVSYKYKETQFTKAVICVFYRKTSLCQTQPNLKTNKK